MVVLTPESKVLIVGSGVSGLVLAQILRGKGIAFEIFERDDGSRKQGWSIALDKCLDHLEPLLPQDLASLYTASANQSIGKADGFCFIDGRTHETLGLVGNVTRTHLGHNISASRELFRNILMQHLTVRFGKRFTNFSNDEQGVKVYFDDGTSTHGTLLVGADGANSRVRSQLLPGFEATPSKYATIQGNVFLSKESYGPILAEGNTGVIVGEPGLKFYILMLERAPDETILFNWNIAFCSEVDGAEGELDHAWTETATPQSLLTRALSLIKHLPQYIIAAVKQTPLSGINTPPIKLMETVIPPQGLPRGNVTLVGDSAHSMVPFRGMGANTSIIDACDLGKAISRGIQDSSDLQWVLENYEATMIPRGREQVLASRAIGESQDSLTIAGGRL